MKFLKLAGITSIVVIALAVLGVTLVFAQNPNPTDTPWWNAMRGMMNGNWESMQQMHDLMTQNGEMDGLHEWMHQSGGVHERVFTALSEQLDLTYEELVTQIEGGKTLAQVAEEKGVSAEQLTAALENGMKDGFAQAVEEGILTQEQADLMLQNMDGQYEWMITNMGIGMMDIGSGMWGAGSGGCHDNSQTIEDLTDF